MTFEDGTEMTDEEFACFAEIVIKIIKMVVCYADKYNIDRDSMMKKLAETISTMSEISTFKQFEV